MTQQPANPFESVPQKDYYLVIKRFKQWYPQMQADTEALKSDLNSFYEEVVKQRDVINRYQKGDRDGLEGKQFKYELESFQQYCQNIEYDIDNFNQAIEENIQQINKYEKNTKQATKEMDKKTLKMYNSLQEFIIQYNSLLRKLQGIKQEGETILRKTKALLEANVE